MNRWLQPVFLLATLALAAVIVVTSTRRVLEPESKAPSALSAVVDEPDPGDAQPRLPSAPPRRPTPPPEPFSNRMPTQWTFDSDLRRQATEWLATNPRPSPARDRVCDWLVRAALWDQLGRPTELTRAIAITLVDGTVLHGVPESRTETESLIEILPWNALTPRTIPKSVVTQEEDLPADELWRRVAADVIRRQEAVEPEDVALIELERAIAIALRRGDAGQTDELFARWDSRGGDGRLLASDAVTLRGLSLARRERTVDLERAAEVPEELEPFRAQTLEDLEERIQAAYRRLGTARDHPERVDELLAESDKWLSWLVTYVPTTAEVEQLERVRLSIQTFRFDARKMRGF